VQPFDVFLAVWLTMLAMRLHVAQYADLLKCPLAWSAARWA
jgi:hypothetical protein